jgi:hypothetical protein
MRPVSISICESQVRENDAPVYERVLGKIERAVGRERESEGEREA